MRLSLLILATALSLCSNLRASDYLSFPSATEPVELFGPAGDQEHTLSEFIATYARATGQHCVMGRETESQAENVLLKSLSGMSLSIPPSRLQITFESYLDAHSFVLIPLTLEGPRLFQIVSTKSSEAGKLRIAALFLPQEHLHEAASHPAVLFSTVLALPTLDVRQTTTSLRSLFHDSITTSLLPMNMSESVLLTGQGDMVLTVTNLLMQAEQAAQATEQARIQAIEQARAPSSAAPSKAEGNQNAQVMATTRKTTCRQA